MQVALHGRREGHPGHRQTRSRKRREWQRLTTRGGPGTEAGILPAQISRSLRTNGADLTGRLELTRQPPHRVRLHGIHRHRDLFGPVAGGAFEYPHFEAALAGRDARQRHPVFARRTHRSVVGWSAHDALARKASYPNGAGCPQASQLRARFSKGRLIVGTAAARRS